MVNSCLLVPRRFRSWSRIDWQSSIHVETIRPDVGHIQIGKTIVVEIANRNSVTQPVVAKSRCIGDILKLTIARITK